MIRSTADGNVRLLTIDRPERRNAFTRDGLDALETALEAAAEPVIYLTGAGDAFSAGADLDTVASLDREAAVAFATRGQEVATALAEYDGVVVAGIDGPARGGGVELALACDVRVATPDATLAETGVRLGLFGAWGGTSRLPDVVGEGNALDIALSGRVLSATEARRMGLVSRVVDEPRTVAESLAENSPAAMRTIKQRIRDDAESERKEKREAAVFGELIDGLDSETLRS